MIGAGEAQHHLGLARRNAGEIGEGLQRVRDINHALALQPVQKKISTHTAEKNEYNFKDGCRNDVLTPRNELTYELSPKECL